MIIARRWPMFAISFASPTLLAMRMAAQEPAVYTRLDPTVRAEVEIAVATARAHGLPTEPIVDKALEGTAKRATPSRIIVAVRTLASGLATARGELGNASDASDLIAGAEALRAGITPSVLGQLRRARPIESLLMPLVVLSDLISRGVPPTSAATAVLELAKRGATDADFGTMQLEVRHDIQAGAPAADAAAVRSRGVAHPYNGSTGSGSTNKGRSGNGKGALKPPKSRPPGNDKPSKDKSGKEKHQRPKQH